MGRQRASTAAKSIKQKTFTLRLCNFWVKTIGGIYSWFKHWKRTEPKNKSADRWPKVEFKEKRASPGRNIKPSSPANLIPNARRFINWRGTWACRNPIFAGLDAENIDWEHSVISFARKKTGSIAIMRFDDELAEILRDLPGNGPLFPYFRFVRAGDRATEFHQRSRPWKSGVSFHSYRYAWAERAKRAGYPERFAQEALGHNSKAIHRSYARNAQVELPPLSEFERMRSVRGNVQDHEPVMAKASPVIHVRFLSSPIDP